MRKKKKKNRSVVYLHHTQKQHHNTVNKTWLEKNCLSFSLLTLPTRIFTRYPPECQNPQTSLIICDNYCHSHARVYRSNTKSSSPNFSNRCKSIKEITSPHENHSSSGMLVLFAVVLSARLYLLNTVVWGKIEMNYCRKKKLFLDAESLFYINGIT